MPIPLSAKTILFSTEHALYALDAGIVEGRAGIWGDGVLDFGTIFYGLACAARPEVQRGYNGRPWKVYF